MVVAHWCLADRVFGKKFRKNYNVLFNRGHSADGTQYLREFTNLIFKKYLEPYS